MGATLGDGGNDRFSRMVPGGHLLRHDDRELHPKLLCAETRRVFVERIFLQFGRLLGDDSVPGGACGDDFCWAQFGPPDGAPISRGDFFAGGRNRVFVADRASFSCRHDRAAVPSGDRLLQLPQPFLGDAQRVLVGVLGRQRDRVHQFGGKPGWVFRTVHGRVHHAKDRHAVRRSGVCRGFHAGGGNAGAIAPEDVCRP